MDGSLVAPTGLTLPGGRTLRSFASDPTLAPASSSPSPPERMRPPLLHPFAVPPLAAMVPLVLEILLAATLLLGGTAPAAAQEWTPLFNGRDLDGWVAKIRGFPPGEDPLGTFQVQDGVITVGYQAYGEFDDRFGHLFYRTPFSHYVLRVEYRFTGDQAPGGPGWAWRNSGVMFHAQSPESMGIEQDFPISLEAQFLGGDGSAQRPTANLCTPGTHVEMDGEIREAHCISADAPTFHGDGWVTVDLVVRGGESISHVVAGDTVLAYGHPVVGGGAVNGYLPSAKADGTPLTGGWIALQSESHPVQFRRIWIRKISPD